MSERQVAFKKDETAWLRQFIEHTGGDVFFPSEVDESLRRAGRSRPEVLCLLQRGEVTYSEKSEFGWQWFIDGFDCDEKPVRIVAEVETNAYRFEVREIIWA